MCKSWTKSQGVHLFIQSLVVFKQRLQSFEDLHLAGDSRWRRGLSLHYRHPQTALMTGHQTLQVLQQQLQHTTKENIHLKLRPSDCFYQRDPHLHTLVLFLSAFSSDISSSFSSSCSRHMFSSFVRVANSYTANRRTTPRLIWHHIFLQWALLWVKWGQQIYLVGWGRSTLLAKLSPQWEHGSWQWRILDHHLTFGQAWIVDRPGCSFWSILEWKILLMFYLNLW